MQTKIKRLKLKPSARDKRRYFLTKATNEKIESSILEYIGILGFAKAAYMPVKDSEIKNFTIGSCLVKSLDEVRAALAMSGIKIQKVSGTISGLKR